MEPLLLDFLYLLCLEIHRPCGSECECLILVAGLLSHAMDVPPVVAVCGLCHHAAVDILV